MNTSHVPNYAPNYVPNYIPNYATRINLKNEIKEACVNGNLDTLQHLMTFVNENNTRDNEITMYIKLACTNNHINIINWFINNEHQADLCVILYWACELNKIDIIDYFIDKVEHTEKLIQNCWDGACVGGHLNVMHMLINKNILFPLTRPEPNPSFDEFFYIGQGNLDSLLFVLKCSERWVVKDGIATISNEYIRSCLLVGKIAATSAKYVEDIGLMFKKTIFSKILEGACITGDIQMIKFAINNGADDFNTGMEVACKHDRLEAVKLMVHYGADDWNSGLSSGCGCGYGCDRICCYPCKCKCKEKTLGSVKYMIECGANNWNKSFVSACGCGNMEMVKLMTQHGANNWNAGFIEACYSGHTDIANFLISSGTVDIDKGFSEFMESFKYIYTNETNINFMKLLVREGATNLNYLADVEEFKLACLYCRYKGKDPSGDIKCNNMLKTYPVYVLLCCKIKNKTWVDKLPQELLRLLHQYL